jgi:hypothetical protein
MDFELGELMIEGAGYNALAQEFEAVHFVSIRLQR